MEFDLTPKKIFRVLVFVISLLVLANILALVSKLQFGHHRLMGFVPMFLLDYELNIPTLYSFLQLVTASALLAMIAVHHRRQSSPFILWAVLSAVFMFLGVDEVAQIHEGPIVALREKYQLTGLLYVAWVLPYGALLLVLVASYAGFLYRLPRKTGIRFIIAGSIFVAGAMGFEMLSGRHLELYGPNSFGYVFFFTCEETLEMLGIAFFIFTLTSYISDEFQSLKISVSD